VNFRLLVMDTSMHTQKPLNTLMASVYLSLLPDKQPVLQLQLQSTVADWLFIFMAEGIDKLILGLIFGWLACSKLVTRSIQLV
jgi:hypothetical protein